MLSDEKSLVTPKRVAGLFVVYCDNSKTFIKIKAYIFVYGIDIAVHFTGINPMLLGILSINAFTVLL